MIIIMIMVIITMRYEEAGDEMYYTIEPEKVVIMIHDHHNDHGHNHNEI